MSTQEKTYYEQAKTKKGLKLNWIVMLGNESQKTFLIEAE